MSWIDPKATHPDNFKPRKQEMKPQCTTAAQCLKELARVMEQFGIEDQEIAVFSKYVLVGGRRCKHHDRFAGVPGNWQFAIAEVEGKPVFPGDKLWCTYSSSCRVIEDDNYDWTQYSWNKPKPKTIMVEMLREDAKHWAGYCQHTPGHVPSTNLYAACAKALKESE